jgi:hypothetical protein
MNLTDPRPHRNRPSPTLDAELSNLADRIAVLRLQAEKAMPGTTGERDARNYLEAVERRFRDISKELRHRRRT